jgi:hypothetical protein
MENARPLGALGLLVVTNNVAYPGVSGTMLEGFFANESQLLAHRNAAAPGRVPAPYSIYAILLCRICM